MQEGLKLLSSGNVENAAALFQEIIEQNPGHGPARLMLGQITLERGEVQQAQEHLEIAVSSRPQRIHLAWHLLGKAYLLQHQYEKAREAFDQSLNESPDFTPARLGRARANLFLNEIDSAIEELRKVKDPEAQLLLGEIFLYAGNKEKAREQFSDIGETEPAAKLFLEALNNDASAERNLKILLGENLASSDAYIAAAIRFHSDSLFEVAYHIDDQNPVPRLFLQKAGKNIPSFSTPQARLLQITLDASKALKEEKFVETEALAEKVTMDRAMHIPARLIRIEAAEKQEKNWDALADYRKIMEWLPDIPAILTRLAILARNTEANEAASCAIQRSLAMKPEDGSLYYIQATILKQEGKVDDSLSACQRAIDLGFQEAPVYVTLGNLYYEKMEISRSIDALEKAIEKDPEAAENIASFALSALTASDSVRLKELLEKHVEAHPENINTLYSLGVLYLNQNQFGKAKEYFLKLKKLAPRHSQVYYNFALLYLREGNEMEAKQAMERFEELKTEERKEFLRQNQIFRLRLEASEAKKKGDNSKAIQLYSQIIDQGTGEKEDLLALGNLELATGKLKEATLSFEKVLQKWPYELNAIEGLLKAAQGMQNSKTASLYQHQLELLSSFCN